MAEFTKLVLSCFGEKCGEKSPEMNLGNKEEEEKVFAGFRDYICIFLCVEL